MRDGGIHMRGVDEVNRQLLLASELTYDHDRATSLAALAHEVGELDDDVDLTALARVDGHLDDLRRGAHADVQAAIDRARRLLRSYRDAVST